MKQAYGRAFAVILRPFGHDGIRNAVKFGYGVFAREKCGDDGIRCVGKWEVYVEGVVRHPASMMSAMERAQEFVNLNLIP
jgi:hypothetical protein